MDNWNNQEIIMKVGINIMPSQYGLIIRNEINYSHDTDESISYSNTTSGTNNGTYRVQVLYFKNS